MKHVFTSIKKIHREENEMNLNRLNQKDIFIIDYENDIRLMTQSKNDHTKLNSVWFDLRVKGCLRYFINLDGKTLRLTKLSSWAHSQEIPVNDEHIIKLIKYAQYKLEISHYDYPIKLIKVYSTDPQLSELMVHLKKDCKMIRFKII